MTQKISHHPQPRDARAVAIEELRAIRTELTAPRELLDEFFGVYLNSRFPYGKPFDRWGRR